MASDPIGALVAILLGVADIAGQVDDRGFGGELPADLAASMPLRAFVIRGSGGVPLNDDSNVEVDTQRVDVFTYGRTPAEAAMLMADVALALRRVERQVAAHTLVHWVNSAGGFSQGREPDTQWPRVFQSFQMLYALARVT